MGWEPQNSSQASVTVMGAWAEHRGLVELFIFRGRGFPSDAGPHGKGWTI